MEKVLSVLALLTVLGCGSTAASTATTTGSGGSGAQGGGGQGGMGGQGVGGQGGQGAQGGVGGHGGQGGSGGQGASGGSGGQGGQGGSVAQGSGGAGGQMLPAPLAICINEFMPSNVSSITDEIGGHGDWIELHNPGDVAIDLSGWSITDDATLPAKNPFPMGLSIPKKGFLLLWADEKVPLGPKHLGFKLAAGGGVVGLFAPDGASDIIAYGNIDADIAVARKPDCCASPECQKQVMQGTPGESNLQVPQIIVDLLPVGSVYHYLDKNQPPGAAWTTTAFDTLGVPSGPAPLGYGDAHIVTQVAAGNDPANKPITTWFRVTFNVTDAAAFTSSSLKLLRDDGALVFLNGVEIARSNLPAGGINQNTLASAGATGAEETTYYNFDFDPALFAEGQNVFTVEIHQSSASSSDLGFDAQISAKRPSP